MEKIVTKGIVLRATATKEADYILNILTDSLGRIAVVARGARRKGSRIAAGSELLAFSELVLYQRGNWYYLDEASTISLFDGIRQDIELLSLASYFAEMTECVTAEDEPVPEILSLLLNSLYALDTLQKPQSIVKAAFELKLLALSGYEPLLDGCAVCGTHNPKEPVFDAQQGVLLLNTVLTVRAHQPNSHKGKGWEILTDRIISELNHKTTPVVFLLWGANARSKKKLITNPQHVILETVHPSPLSAYGGFFGCRHFSQANRVLEQSGQVPIDWTVR